MRPILRNSLLVCGTAICLALLTAGCNNANDKPADAAPAPAMAKPAASDKPAKQGGMVAGSAAIPAPPGVQTGNYAGGKK
jgi:hypothetical protein